MEINNETRIVALAREENKYLASEELSANVDTIVTIVRIVQEAILNPRTNKTSTKTVIYFKEDIKPIVCNKTNMLAIHKATGADVVGEAVGKQIAIFADPTVMFGKKVTGGIRVSAFAPGSDEYKKDLKERNARFGRSEALVCEECGSEIHGAAGKSAAEIAQIAKTNTGKRLCVNCMKAVAAKTKAGT